MSTIDSTDSGQATGGSDATGDDSDGSKSPFASSRSWYETRFGGLLVLFDVALTGTIALASVVLFGGLVPAYVYLFSALGALGYVFRALMKEFDSHTVAVLQVNVRMIAAVPLSAGVYLLSDAVQQGDPKAELVAGLAFVAGLFVNLTYNRLADVAERMLKREEAHDSEVVGGDDSATNGDDSSGNGSNDTEAGS